MDSLPVNQENFTSYEKSELLVPKRIPLPFWTCFFINHTQNGSFPTLDSNTFYSCKLKIRYLLETECSLGGSSIVPCGYWICVAITAIIVLLANFGIISNILNLIILPKSLKGCSVKRLMMLLAMFDLLASVCAIPASLLMLFILGRYENRFEALQAFRYLYLFFSLGRTGSIFITIMITIERYIAVAFPLKQWLTPKKARIYLVIVLSIIILINLPWWLNKRLVRNETFNQIFDEDNSSFSDLNDFPYIFKGTAFSRNIYPNFVMFHLFVDFAVPFPLLLIFNGLLYRAIYLANKIRQTLTISQRREINAAKMFCIVAFILLLCHTVAFVIFILTQVGRQTFRELQFCQVLSMTLNASINFMIYYLFGKSFRNEFRNLVLPCKLFGDKVAVTPSTSSNGTIEMGVTGKARSIKQRVGDKVHA